MRDRPKCVSLARDRVRPDGLATVIERWDTSLERLPVQAARLLLAVEGIERPGNLGTLIRTASGAGAGVIVAGGATSIFHPDVVQASVGALYQVPIGEATTEDTLDWLHGRTRVVAASPHAAKPYWAADYGGSVTIAVGSERHGLTPAWLEAADEVVSIPMLGSADSLNVAVATGILLFEAARQRAGPSSQKSLPS